MGALSQAPLTRSGSPPLALDPYLVEQRYHRRHLRIFGVSNFVILDALTAGASWRVCAPRHPRSRHTCQSQRRWGPPPVGKRTGRGMGAVGSAVHGQCHPRTGQVEEDGGGPPETDPAGLS